MAEAAAYWIEFQSTLPVWGGTLQGKSSPLSARYFNPPSPCGEGRRNLPARSFADIFQSTLPVWGGTKYTAFLAVCKAFQSTLPVWGGTKLVCNVDETLLISIHPPRVGRDTRSCWLAGCIEYFNPPSPCGEGHRRSCPR